MNKAYENAVPKLHLTEHQIFISLEHWKTSTQWISLSKNKFKYSRRFKFRLLRAFENWIPDIQRIGHTISVFDYLIYYWSISSRIQRSETNDAWISHTLSINSNIWLCSASNEYESRRSKKHKRNESSLWKCSKTSFNRTSVIY